ncbi:uncharacterized protein M421DRAFT_306422 [Didymella exigua CBS 183.55]|uniref:Uncharacterized protein n=1 Tax=Didymella exigua CBS 183.55 TaxID=1150837 RepID=A0A6A5RAX3_9PLEO|nr:uncharacterized protein M421DRAFT_306422 [Didymella exigua CBS 183.55]KAF1923816.1 hypothetical protein M421DRAFT_306422 [Didymella exigua CBS 183.55]
MKSSLIHLHSFAIILTKSQPRSHFSQHPLQQPNMCYVISISAIAGLLASTISAFPHDLMVSNKFVRDVGVLYPNSNFTGTPLYLVTHKKALKCETAIADYALGSAQVCIPSTCIFYKNADCTLSEVGNDYFFNGPVDVDNLQAVPDMACDSYMCGPVEEMAHIISNTASVYTNSEGGHWGVVGRD